MLKSKKNNVRLRKKDWFPIKTYLHFDAPLSRQDATKLVTSPDEVRKHSFLPLIEFEQRQRRYARKPGKNPTVKFKPRRIAYCSNVDGCILSFYASELGLKYEKLLDKEKIQDVVIGYRKVGSNIDLAYQVFQEIKTRKSCVAFCFDIKGFFDNIDHGVLKRNWCRVLGKERLPDDHFTIYSRITKFATVNRSACLRRLGYSPLKRDKDFVNKRICSINSFRAKIRGDDGLSANLVVPWRRKYRIPQGTPISALAANIAMIDFDVKMKGTISALGGVYRRYSDDIFVVVPSKHRLEIPTLIKDELRLSTKTLRLNEKKTDETEFIAGSLASGRGTKPLQYLGFLFDGERHYLRSSTISKFYRRIHRAVGAARQQQTLVIKGKKKGRPVMYKRKIYLKNTHLGKGSFLNSYVKAANLVMPGKEIKQQLSGHTKFLQRLIKRQEMR